MAATQEEQSAWELVEQWQQPSVLAFEGLDVQLAKAVSPLKARRRLSRNSPMAATTGNRTRNQTSLSPDDDTTARNAKVR